MLIENPRGKKPNYGRQHNINVETKAEKKQENRKKVKITTHAIQFLYGIKMQPSPTTLSTRTRIIKCTPKNTAEKQKKKSTPHWLFFRCFHLRLMKCRKHVETQQAKRKMRTFIAAKETTKSSKKQCMHSLRSYTRSIGRNNV